MHFWKMNGAGNDFIIINNMVEKVPHEKLSDIAKKLCERHLSIGADGFMVVESPLKGADYRMIFYNSDGSLGEMCGNGARCICRYGKENNLAGDIQTIETDAGIVTGEKIDDRNYKVRLNNPTTIRKDFVVNVDGKDYTCSYVELGNPGIPHAVVPIENLKKYPTDELLKLGRKLRYHSEFPKGANVNFYEMIDEHNIIEKTYERGVEDFTYACGTGTASMVAVLLMKGLTDGKDVHVQMRGGILTIEINHEDGQIKDLFLIGDTNIVAKGEVTDEDLNLVF